MALDFHLLRLLREKRGLTQQEAAEKAGMSSRQHWNQIESGRRGGITLETLDKIAAALGVKAKDLLK
jgi:transcriptional regulator with XRE-family HTH domain